MANFKNEVSRAHSRTTIAAGNGVMIKFTFELRLNVPPLCRMSETPFLQIIRYAHSGIPRKVPFPERYFRTRFSLAIIIETRQTLEWQLIIGETLKIMRPFLL